MTSFLGGDWWVGVLLGLIAAVMATLGDLCESVMKRDLGIKDMSQVIPGHGGLMDRLDSLLATVAPIWLVLHYLVFYEPRMRLLVTGGRTGYLGRHVVAAAAAHEVVAVGSVDADVRDARRRRVARRAGTAPTRSSTPPTSSPTGASPPTGAAHVARRGRAARRPAGAGLQRRRLRRRRRPYDETAPPDPVTPYGAAKAAAETRGARHVCPTRSSRAPR